MKQLIILFMSLSLLLSSCENAENTSGNKIIGKSDITIKNGLMTPEVLFSFGRIGSIAISKDKKKIAYEVRYYSIPENKSNCEIMLVNADGTDKKQITKSVYSESNPIFLSNDEKILFLNNESGKSQIWIMNIDGTERKQVSDYESDIESFNLSPDEKKFYSFLRLNAKSLKSKNIPI